MISKKDLFRIRTMLTDITYNYAEMLTEQGRDIAEIKRVLTNEVLHKLEDHELALKDIKAFLQKRFPEEIEHGDHDPGGEYVRTKTSGAN